MGKSRLRDLRTRRIFLVLSVFSALPALMFACFLALTLFSDEASDSTTGPPGILVAGASVFGLVFLITLIGFVVATVRLSRQSDKRRKRAALEPLAEWREMLSQRFGMSDLRTLCFDLRIDYDNLPGATKADKVKALLLHVHKEQRLDDMVEVGMRQRPDISWDDLPKVSER